MSKSDNVIPFPRRDHLEAFTGTDKATGQPVTILEHVSAEGRTVVADCRSYAEFDAAIQVWLEDGVDLWPDGAA